MSNYFLCQSFWGVNSWENSLLHSTNPSVAHKKWEILLASWDWVEIIVKSKSHSHRTSRRVGRSGSVPALPPADCVALSTSSPSWAPSFHLRPDWVRVDQWLLSWALCLLRVPGEGEEEYVCLGLRCPTLYSKPEEIHSYLPCMLDFKVFFENQFLTSNKLKKAMGLNFLWGPFQS